MGRGVNLSPDASPLLLAQHDNSGADRSGHQPLILYNMSAYEGTIGTYTFDSDGEVVGLSIAVAEVLPLAERTPENAGWKILGLAPVLP